MTSVQTDLDSVLNGFCMGEEGLENDILLSEDESNYGHAEDKLSAFGEAKEIFKKEEEEA